MRQIYINEEKSGLSIKCDLLDELAPQSAEFLWQLSQTESSYNAIHAIWTGPELSCPLPAHTLPETLSHKVLPPENATSYPQAGDIILACIPDKSVTGLPPGNFFDLGIFYNQGGRLLMPFGWIMGNVCAKIIKEDLEHARSSIEKIRQNGGCKISIKPVG